MMRTSVLLAPPRSLFFVLCSLLFFFLLSCQTTPAPPDMALEEAEFVPLNPGASAYIFVDIQNARPILDNIHFWGMDTKQMRQMFDRTVSAAAAMYSPYDTRAYQLAAWGRYPASGGKIAFGSSKDWKKMRSSLSETEYWHSEKGQISIAMSSRQVFVSAVRENAPGAVHIDPFPVSPGTAIPENFNAFRRGAVLSCWLENPSTVINQKLQEMGLPVELPAEQFFISLFPASEQADDVPQQSGEPQYEAVLRMKFASAVQARALTGVFAVIRNLLSFRPNVDEDNSGGFTALAPILFANPPEQDGSNLVIKTNALSVQDIALLFNVFSVR